MRLLIKRSQNRYMQADIRPLRVLALLALLVPGGCATQHLQTERMLSAAQFVPVKVDTPELKKEMAVLPPYTLMPIKNSKKQLHYYFASPARRTVFVGDPKAYARLGAIQQQEAQIQQMRAAESQRKWANFQQALAYGMAAGAMNAAQQPVYQPPIYQPPPPLNVASAFGGQAPGIVAQDGTYLGKLSANRYDPDSVSNPYGRYGSRYSPTSINNPYSPYGSPYSPRSANNPYATQAPALIGY